MIIISGKNIFTKPCCSLTLQLYSKSKDNEFLNLFNLYMPLKLYYIILALGILSRVNYILVVHRILTTKLTNYLHALLHGRTNQYLSSRVVQQVKQYFMCVCGIFHYIIIYFKVLRCSSYFQLLSLTY